MVPQLRASALLITVAACGSGPAAPGATDGALAGEPDAAAAAPAPLAVHFLGVQGWVLQHEDDVVLTAPLFTRASVLDVSVGNPVPADAGAIDAGLAGIELAGARALVTGHAHYDHLLDVPHIMAAHAPDATLYANESARHLLAAFAPDRGPACTGPAAAEPIERDRVVAFDDSLASAVDYRNCPALRPPGVPLEGSWVRVPGSRIRIYPVCSVHPDQFLFIHFGPGAVTDDQCTPPPRAGDWLEGMTLAYVIDFLDDDDRPAFRVFYQDAPTDGPVGQPPADVLADRPVDLVLLCAGSTDQVADHPTEILAALAPRFALSGHWEDFFRPASEPPQPIPFLDVDAYQARAAAAMTGAADPPLVVEGQPVAERHVMPPPGMRFVVPPAP